MAKKILTTPIQQSDLAGIKARAMLIYLTGILQLVVIWGIVVW